MLLKAYAEYYNGYKDGEKQVRGYASLVAELLEKFPLEKESLASKIKKILSSSTAESCACGIF